MSLAAATALHGCARDAPGDNERDRLCLADVPLSYLWVVVQTPQGCPVCGASVSLDAAGVSDSWPPVFRPECASDDPNCQPDPHCADAWLTYMVAEGDGMVTAVAGEGRMTEHVWLGDIDDECQDANHGFEECIWFIVDSSGYAVHRGCDSPFAEGSGEGTGDDGSWMPAIQANAGCVASEDGEHDAR